MADYVPKDCCGKPMDIKDAFDEEYNTKLTIYTCGVCKKSEEYLHPDEVEPNYEDKCVVCEQVPTMPLTGMCGPCTTGESATAGGNW